METFGKTGLMTKCCQTKSDSETECSVPWFI